MTITPIYTTRKLEKTAKNFIASDEEYTNKYLGDWSADILYVNRKKCWLVIHSETRYLVILPGITSSDLKNILELFKKTFHDQLITDGVNVDFELVDQLIGTVRLCKTNNDRSIRGTLNQYKLDFDYWKDEFRTYENMPFMELCRRLNSLKQHPLKWNSPKDKLSDLINSIRSDVND